MWQPEEEVGTLLDVDHEDIILRTFILFTQASDAVAKYANAHFYRKNSLSTIKFMVLQILATNGGTMSPSEIAEWTLRERHDITTLVDRLERDELVTTERSDKDRRFKNVILTDKGRSVLTDAVPTAREIINQTMSSISESDVALLERLSKTLRQNAHDGLKSVLKRKEILGAKSSS